jgi:cytochrome c peroxidase
MIRDYEVVSTNFNDFSLEDNSVSIFDKTLYKGQNAKGIYIAVDDEATLSEIKQVGKLLFYDPVLSVNNKRSCSSCHKPTEYFTDTTKATSPQFDNQQTLTRNTPTLINVVYNHLLMLDGKHISLMNQARDVVGNPSEMGGADENEIVKKVLSCREYDKAFRRFVKLTPNSKKINLDHIVSAVILYYSSFSNYYSSFDDAMNDNKPISSASEKGFNIFMSKAKCGTCHFVPQFNGVKPPYISTEFEVLGVPADTAYSKLSPDSGRARINPAPQTMNAFRTGSIRNAAFTKPYMHNGVFNTLDEVISFYNAGGGVGKGLKISNQTLSADSLKLSKTEKETLKAFINSLNENIKFEDAPGALPISKDKNLNNRKVGGEY